MEENLDKAVYFSCLQEGFKEIIMIGKCGFLKGLLKILLPNYLKMIDSKSVC